MKKLKLIKDLNLEPINGFGEGLEWQLKGHGTVIRRNVKNHTKKMKGDFTVSHEFDYIKDNIVFTVNPENGDIVIKEK